MIFLKRLISFLLSLCLLLTLCACGKKESSPQQDIPAKPPAEQEAEKNEEAVPEQPPVEILPQPEDPLDIKIRSMSLEEKVGQLFFVRCPADQAVEDVSTYHLGGYILFGRDFKDKTANEVIQSIASYQEAASIPLLIGVDEEGGTVVRASSNPHLRSSKFSSPQKLYAKGGTEAVQKDAKEKSIFLKALGINVNLAPVADVSVDPNDFIYPRAFGEDAVATSYYVATVVDTMREYGMGSVLKHFPGYGNNVDTHTGIALDDRPCETFSNNDFLPFEAGIAEGGETSAVLVSHNIVSCMDPHLPASLSPAVHEILRTELNFDGVVMTDDLAMEAVAAYSEDGSVAVMAIEAGNDIVLTTDYRTQIPKVIEAVHSGALPEEMIDAACKRVLTWKAALGLI